MCELNVSQATLSKEEMFMLCHFGSHTLLMLIQHFITKTEKLFYKAFCCFFFFFQIEAYVVVSICVSI